MVLSRVSLLANMTPHFYSLDPIVITLILPYVDDVIITFDNVVGICALQQFLNQHFEMEDLDTLSFPSHILICRLLSLSSQICI